MILDTKEQFALFESLGEKKVGENIAAHVWSEERVRLGRKNGFVRRIKRAHKNESAPTMPPRQRWRLQLPAPLKPLNELHLQQSELLAPQKHKRSLLPCKLAQPKSRPAQPGLQTEEQRLRLWLRLFQ